MSQNSSGDLSGEPLTKKQSTDVTDVVYKYRWIIYFLLFDLTLWGIAMYLERLGTSTSIQGISMYDSIAVVTGAFAILFAVLGAIAIVVALIVSLWRRYKVRKHESRRA